MIGFALFRQMVQGLGGLKKTDVEKVSRALQRPGPDVVVIDEGTIAKNPEVCDCNT